MKIIDFFTKKEYEFNNENINLYVCGPTVYDKPHIGNMRPIIFFDVLNRVYSLKYKVTFVHNFTDVDDKIIQKSKELKISENELTEENILIYKNLIKKLNVIEPNFMPKVSDEISGMIKFIEKLIEKGFAYESNGSIYYEVSKFANYGLLSELKTWRLVDKNNSTEKRNFYDFALWKKTNTGINWSSPWSKGRPGWHTECAYFIHKYFKNQGVDIHGGGIDLKFPHHVNEMAQYEAYYDTDKTSKTWVYVGHLLMSKTEKMSKSLNNFIYTNEFIEKYDSNTLRLLLLSKNYQKPIIVNEQVIDDAQNLLLKIKNAIIKFFINLPLDYEYNKSFFEPSKEIVSILENNLDTPNAITYILEKVKKMNLTKFGKEVILKEIIADLELLGIKFEINYNNLKAEIFDAKMKKNYKKLDELKLMVVK